MSWKKVLIKLSGEALAGPLKSGFDHETMRSIVSEICGLKDMGLRVGITIGGGNIFRGSFASKEIRRVSADYMGMLATVMNGIALRDLFEHMGKPAEVYSPLGVISVAEPYNIRNALRSFDEGKILIFSGGTGRPFFTTDTAASLTAVELGCDLLVKATNVDGVYSADPVVDKSATLYRRISYQEALEKNLRVMDLTAFTLLKDNNLPLVVLNIHKKGSLAALARGEQVGTLVSE